MTNDSVDKLIKEIAAEHGVALGRDDPILILQTINLRLIQDSQKAQETMLEQYKQELEEIMARTNNDAKLKAERILNATMIAGKETLVKTLKDSTDLVREEINNLLVSAQAQLDIARRLSTWSLVAAVIMFLFISIILLVILTC